MSAPTLATSHTAGLRFVKLDLHLHTPASECFADRSVSAQAIVKEALEKGLDGIAVTDHNSGAWVDEVKQAATGSGLVVFPGCESVAWEGNEGFISSPYSILHALGPASGEAIGGACGKCSFMTCSTGAVVRSPE